MRPYSRPTLTPLGSVQQLTQSKALPGVAAHVPGFPVVLQASNVF